MTALIARETLNSSLANPSLLETSLPAAAMGYDKRGEMYLKTSYRDTTFGGSPRGLIIDPDNDETPSGRLLS